jgi:two-component system LytT family response regulator
MNAMIIDDERPARTELARLLAGFPAVRLVGEAASAPEARDLIERLKPDLVFLDIEMPEQNGFELLESLQMPHPHVIFTTAYNAYAVQAFEVNALDYLLKPINPRRLGAAIERVAKSCRDQAQLPVREPVAGSPLRPDDHVFVRDGDRCWFVPVRALRLLESDGNYTRLYFDNAAPLLYRTLNSMEERLPPELFMRANRSQIINLTMIEEIGQWFSGSLKVKLKGGTEVEFSRRQAQLFRERMSL